MHDDITDETIRAGIIAHAIRLGKCPPPGQCVEFSAQVQIGELEDIQKGDFSKVENRTQKVWLGFQVTREDIESAKQLINSQRISYREPKTSLMRFGDAAITVEPGE